MNSVGQGCLGGRRESERPCFELDAQGFTMVVLLVVMAVMAVGMSALLPTWRQQAIREQEEELIFRGNQYARALVLYSRKNNNLLPSNIDVLYTGKYLRKKYKDPITGEDFGLLGAGEVQGAAGRGSTGQTTGRGGSGGRSGGAPSQSGLSGTRIVGSIQGFYSTSTDTSIRVYQDQQRYIDWPFTVQTAQLMMGQARLAPSSNGRDFGGDRGIGPRPGRGRGGAAAPGGRGGGRAGGTRGGGPPVGPGPPVVGRGRGGG